MDFSTTILTCIPQEDTYKLYKYHHKIKVTYRNFQLKLGVGNSLKGNTLTKPFANSSETSDRTSIVPSPTQPVGNQSNRWLSHATRATRTRTSFPYIKPFYTFSNCLARFSLPFIHSPHLVFAFDHAVIDLLQIDEIVIRDVLSQHDNRDLRSAITTTLFPDLELGYFHQPT